MTTTGQLEENLRVQIRQLQNRLADAEGKLANSNNNSVPVSHASCPQLSASLHALVTLSDSALPLGSFALSAGLESFNAHQVRSSSLKTLSSFRHFLRLSLRSLASTTLPYVRAAYQDPASWARFDNDFDASTTCAVARRASLSQGRALITVWERSLKTDLTDVTPVSPVTKAREILDDACTRLRRDTSPKPEEEHNAPFDGLIFQPQGHLAPLMGVLCVATTLSMSETLYLFVIAHAKMVLSAGVRASSLGPYQAQHILACTWLKQEISQLVSLHAVRATGSAAQTVPMLDVWTGRHDLIYSRIFNS